MTVLATLARQTPWPLPRLGCDWAIDRSPIHFRSPGLRSALCSRSFFQGTIVAGQSRNHDIGG